MVIYIVRHGVAAELDNEIVEEGYRYLTVAGRNHCKIVATKLKDLKTEVDLMISSPLIRAVQTAEVFASVLKYEGEIKTAIELVGGVTSARFMQMLRRYSHHKSVALFGHAPDVYTFALNLAKKNDIKELRLHFHNSSVCKINYDMKSETGSFDWFLDANTMKLFKG
jgi:phosphohistidine phosphatase SixA